MWTVPTGETRDGTRTYTSADWTIKRVGDEGTVAQEENDGPTSPSLLAGAEHSPRAMSAGPSFDGLGELSLRPRSPACGITSHMKHVRQIVGLLREMLATLNEILAARKDERRGYPSPKALRNAIIRRFERKKTKKNLI